MDNEEKLQWYEKRYGPIIEKKGMHNVKNLFRKPTLNEWVILFCIIMCLTLTFLYKVQIKNCQEQIDDIFTHPYEYSKYFNYYQNEFEGDTLSIPVSLQIFQGVLT